MLKHHQVGAIMSIMAQRAKANYPYMKLASIRTSGVPKEVHEEYIYKIYGSENAEPHPVIEKVECFVKRISNEQLEVGYRAFHINKLIVTHSERVNY